MTEPLLTIDDATREFHVSAKTVRRRLTSGAIEGAFKRPGARGEEWVIPRASLVAAGFVPRPEVDASQIPEDPEAGQEYWRERALAAETALRSRSRPRAATDRWPRASGVGWLFVALALVLAAVATVLALTDDEPSADAAPMDAVTATLLELTDPGDPLGIVGTVSARFLPDDRTPVQIDGDSLSGTTPRYVVAAEGEPATRALIDHLATASRTVLAVDRGTGDVRIFDRGQAEPSGVDAPPSTAPSTVGDGSGPMGPVAPPAPSETSPPPTEEVPPSETGGDVPDVPEPDEPEPVGPTSPPAREVVVQEGDNFWSIAVDQLAAGGTTPTDADVVPYWQLLIDANADVLVEPGNPDLLHVGQQLELPPPPA